MLIYNTSSVRSTKRQNARVAQRWSTSLPRRGSRVRSPSRALWKLNNLFYMREWLSGGAPPCQGGGRGFDPRLALFYILYIRGYPYEISSFFIFERIYARRFDLVVCRLDRCISVASTRRHAPSRALDESLFESAFGVFSSFFIYLLQTENLLLIKIGVNS